MSLKSFMATLSLATMASVAFAGNSATLQDAFSKDFKVKGMVGFYGENTDKDNESATAGGKEDGDFGWMTGFLKLKYETGRWNNLKLGAEFLAHNKLWNDAQDKSSEGDGVNGGYDKDLEDNSGLSELYLDYAFTEKTNLRIGKWSHKKITHIDDSQAQGVYLQTSEIDGLTLTVGAINAFAEIDYDDFEDFNKDSQDLTSDKYESIDADDVLYFAELKYSPVDNITINPYYYHQADYASVAGADLDVNAKIADSAKVGLKVKAYQVSEDTKDTTDEDGGAYTLEPYAKVGNFSIAVGYTQTDGDHDDSKTAMNKPAWMRDYLTGFDQDKIMGDVDEDSTGQYVKLGYKAGDFKFHLAYGQFETEGAADDDEIDEFEAIVNYKIAKNCDWEVRYFDVDYNDAAGDKDYEKVETRLRYKF